MAMRSFLGPNSTWAASFQYRDFRFLWGATLLHSLAMGMEQMALSWLVLSLTESPFMVGVSAAARMAPFFFLGILSGAITDRVDRRIFLRLVTIGGSIIAFIMAAMLLSGVENVWYVIALAAATGCMWAFVMTIRHSYTFDIVGPEKALNGLSLNAMGQRFGGVIGSLVAGVIVSQSGVGVQYLVIGAANAASVLFLLAARDVGQAAPKERESVMSNLAGYFQLLRENRTLMVLMLLTSATEVFGFTHQSVLVVYSKDVLGLGPLGFGFVTAVRQGGGALGLLLLAFMANTRRKGWLMFASATGFGLGQVAFFWSKHLVVFLLVLGFINACASIVDTLYKTLMQLNVTNEQRGRATGSWVLSIGVAPIGHLGVGVIAGSFGAPAALLVNGSMLTAISIAAALGMPRIRRLQ